MEETPQTTEQQSETPKVPVHQWTDENGDVLIIKCVNEDMASYGGFVWPESGPVAPEHWSREPNCESGGLFGWPWGIGIGDGKDPGGKWLVFRAKPENVIHVGPQKCKAVPGEDGALPEVVYCGGMAGAMALTIKQRIAWIFHNATNSIARGTGASSAATGYGASSGATGTLASSAATGECASSAATGTRASSAATGDGASSAAKGYGASSAAKGTRASSAATGDFASSAATGDGASSAATGTGASSAATGYRASSAATGYGASSAATGYRASSAATGDGASSAATGECASSAATGECASSAAIGYCASSAATGECASSAAIGYCASSAATGDGAFAHSDYRAMAGVGGAFTIRWYDYDASKWRFFLGVVGDGIKEDTWYIVRDGKLTEEVPA